MKAELILKLLNEQNYEELKRAALEELDAKSKNSDSKKARIALSKKIAKLMKNEKHVAEFEGATTICGKQVLSNLCYVIEYEDAVEGCETARMTADRFEKAVRHHFEGATQEVTAFELADFWKGYKAFQASRPTNAAIKKDKSLDIIPLVAVENSNGITTTFNADYIAEILPTLEDVTLYVNPKPKEYACAFLGSNGRATLFPTINVTQEKTDTVYTVKY